MDQSTVNWIATYMEWTNADSWTFGPDPLARDGFAEAGDDAGWEFTAAYLDWIDAWHPLGEYDSRYHAIASAGDADGIGDYISGLDEFCDAIMVALHTDSDCMPYLRQIIDAGNTSQRTATPA